MKITKQRHNGWSNWDTWEAYNMLTSFEDIYLDVANNNRLYNLEYCLVHALERAGADIEHIAFHRVNWCELARHLFYYDRPSQPFGHEGLL